MRRSLILATHLNISQLEAKKLLEYCKYFVFAESGVFTGLGFKEIPVGHWFVYQLIK